MNQLVNEVVGLALGTVLTVDNADWFNKDQPGNEDTELSRRCHALEKVGFNAIASTPYKVTLRKDLPPGRYLC